MSSSTPPAGSTATSSFLPKLFASRLNLKADAATAQSSSDALPVNRGQLRTAVAGGSTGDAQKALRESVQGSNGTQVDGKPMDALRVTLSDGAAGVVRFGKGRFEIVRDEAKQGGIFGQQGDGKQVFATDLVNLLSLRLDLDCPAGPTDMTDPAPASPSKERPLLPKLGLGLRKPSSTRLTTTTTSAKGAFIVKIDALARKTSSGALRLVSVFVRVAGGVGADEVDEWMKRAIEGAYPDSTPGRAILLLVNPVGGKGKARSVVDTAVLPILRAAGCKVDVVETKHAKHAEEIARSTSLNYDIIAAASGDGLIHEVINGFATRKDARKAFGIPIVPIPTGSANGLCINLFGVKDTFNVPLACLNAIKGQPLPLDLCAIVRQRPPGEDGSDEPLERRWSFMSQAMGLMCDLDLGTENMRWMGDARFVVGFLKGIVSNKPMRCRIHIDAVVSSKALMIQQLNARRAAVHRGDIAPVAEEPLQTAGAEKVADVIASDSAVDAAPSRGEAVSEATATEEGDEAAQAGAFVLEDDDDEPETPAARENPPVVSGPVAPAPPADHQSLPPVRLLQPQPSWMTIDSGEGFEAAYKKETDKAAGNTENSSVWQNGVGMLYVYAGLQPYVARDLMQFPVAMPGEGVVDIVVQSLVARATLANAITGAEKGKQFYMDCQHYYKARAYVVEPLEPGALVSIDGEAMPFERFSVEVHPRLARTASLLGGWADGGFGREEGQ